MAAVRISHEPLLESRDIEGECRGHLPAHATATAPRPIPYSSARGNRQRPLQRGHAPRVLEQQLPYGLVVLLYCTVHDARLQHLPQGGRVLHGRARRCTTVVQQGTARRARAAARQQQAACQALIGRGNASGHRTAGSILVYRRPGDGTHTASSSPRYKPAPGQIRSGPLSHLTHGHWPCCCPLPSPGTPGPTPATVSPCFPPTPGLVGQHH